MDINMRMLDRQEPELHQGQISRWYRSVLGLLVTESLDKHVL